MARHVLASPHTLLSLFPWFCFSCPLLPTVFVSVSCFYLIVQILCVAIINSIGAIDITSDQIRCYFFYVRAKDHLGQFARMLRVLKSADWFVLSFFFQTFFNNATPRGDHTQASRLLTQKHLTYLFRAPSNLALIYCHTNLL